MPTSNANEPYDVVLAGFGPTGATLAALLGRAGHRVRVIEREAEVYRLPRAVHFDHEVMRIFQSAGVARAVLPHTASIDDYRFLNADRELLLGGTRVRAESPHVAPDDRRPSGRHQAQQDPLL